MGNRVAFHVSIVAFAAALAFSLTGRAESDSTITTKVGPFEQPSVLAGVKSYDDAGRVKEYDDAAHQTPGRMFKSKNEYFLGLKSKAGYGVIAQAVETATGYVDNSYKSNTFNAGDASIAFTHPIYKNERISLSGMFREYFPVCDNSVTMHQYQQAYYLFLSLKLKDRWDLFNVLIPRYFGQDSYRETPGKSPDTTFYTEDLATLTRQENAWFRWGIGEHFQIEAHRISPVGKTLEIFPMADFMLSPTIFAGPRIYFPVAAQNSVYDSPTGVSMANVQAELYLQAAL